MSKNTPIAGNFDDSMWERIFQIAKAEQAMNTTNDEQAPYGKDPFSPEEMAAKANQYGHMTGGIPKEVIDRYANRESDADFEFRKRSMKPAERAPMLSDEGINEGPSPFSVDMEWHDGAHWARNWYEAKITSGELRVVKTCKYTVNYKDYKCCSACDFRSNPIEWGPLTGNDMWRFCPGCGAEIVK